MTGRDGGEEMDHDEWVATLHSYKEEYSQCIISEAMFRERLRKLGLKPAEIEHEVSVSRPRGL